MDGRVCELTTVDGVCEREIEGDPERRGVIRIPVTVGPFDWAERETQDEGGR